MRGVMEYAKYFMQKATGLDNTLDGNMKLQKLLTFANLINIALNDEPLFSETMRAFKNGCVIETVRLNYRECYQSLKEASKTFKPNFSNSEFEILDLTLGIFDKLSAKELSNLNHEFEFWENAYKRYKSTNDSVDSNISEDEIKNELHVIKSIIDSYKNRDNSMLVERVNGIDFFYDPKNLDIDGFVFVSGEEVSILDELYEFSLSEEAEDNCYTIYLDDGELVIF